MLQAIILGIIQGITEFIPVSSSGHLTLLPKILDWTEQSTIFDVVLHGGTLLALLIIYRKRIFNILKDLGRSKLTNSLVVNIIITTIPALIIGYFFQDTIDEKFKSEQVIAIMLISLGIIFIFSDLIYFSKVNKGTVFTKYLSLKQKDALMIGLLQPIAFIRGTSRSGITTLGGLLQGMDLANALDYSFLISIPIVAISFIFSLFDLLKNGLQNEEPAHLLAGFMAALISGLIAINFMLKFTTKLGFKWFGVYRIIIGIVILYLFR